MLMLLQLMLLRIFNAFSKMSRMAALVALVFLSWHLYAQAIDNNNQSSVIAVFKQMGVSVEGKFNQFAAHIDFDPAKPENGQAQVDIDVASFDLGDPQYNAEVTKKEWFNAAQFPKARFVSTQIKALSLGQYEAKGKLSIKGKTLDVVVPIRYKSDASSQTFEGTLPIKRLTFNIGEGDWKDTGMVADEVTIKFKVITALKK